MISLSDDFVFIETLKNLTYVSNCPQVRSPLSNGAQPKTLQVENETRAEGGGENDDPSGANPSSVFIIV